MSSGGPVSLRDRLKQYQGLKENTQSAYIPPQRQQELDFISKRSPLQTSLRMLQVREGSFRATLPLPDLDDEDKAEDKPAKDGGQTAEGAEVPAATETPAALDSAAGEIASEQTEEQTEADKPESKAEKPKEEKADETGEAKNEDDGLEKAEETVKEKSEEVGNEEEEEEVTEGEEIEEEEVTEVEEEEEVVEEEEMTEVEEEEELIGDDDDGGVFEEVSAHSLEDEQGGVDDDVVNGTIEDNVVKDDVVNETVKDDSVGDTIEASNLQDIMDEKSVDEFVDDIRPINTAEGFSAQEEAPDDEMAALRLQQIHTEDDPSNCDPGKDRDIPVMKSSEVDQQSTPEDNFADFGDNLGDAIDDHEQDIETGMASENKAQSPPPSSPSNEDITGIKSTSRNPAAGLPKEDPNKKRLECIMVGLVMVLMIAILAIILPFVIDSDNDVTPKGTIIPTFTPTGVPTLSPGPTIAPTPTPTSDPTAAPLPTVSPAPTMFVVLPTPAPTVPPTPAPTVPPTPAPTVRQTPTPTIVPVPTAAPTTATLQRFIDVLAIPISGEEAFEDKNSPQYRAAEFISNDDDYVDELTTVEQLQERYVASTFYFATEGDMWTTCSQNDADCTSPWLTGDVCDWFSVSCNNNGRISSIAFDIAGGNGLIGAIPLEVYLFQELTEFVIIDEEIGGTLPALFGTNVTTLQRMVLQGTEISGSIPDDYLSNSPLELFLLGGNQFTGSIPANAGNRDTLQEMDLGGNQLTGLIPEELGSYASLSILALDSNNLRGSIPDSIFGLPSLEQLYLQDNTQISGSLPSAVSGLTSVQELRLGGSSLTGAIPDEIFELLTLQELDLSRAKFRGPLSSTFFALGDTLRQLNLDNNQFFGTVPTTFGALTRLNTLNLHGNDLTGSIAPEICALRGDTILNLQELTVDCDEVTCVCCTQCYR